MVDKEIFEAIQREIAAEADRCAENWLKEKEQIRHDSAESVHNAWWEMKKDAGYVPGKETNPNAKPPTHKCMVPFDQLSPEDAAYDYETVDTTLKALEEAGCSYGKGQFTTLEKVLAAIEAAGYRIVKEG